MLNLEKLLFNKTTLSISLVIKCQNQVIFIMLEIISMMEIQQITGIGEKLVGHYLENTPDRYSS